MSQSVSLLASIGVRPLRQSRFPLRDSATYRNGVADFLFAYSDKTRLKQPFQGAASPYCLSIKLPIGNRFLLLHLTMQNNDFQSNTPQGCNL